MERLIDESRRNPNPRRGAVRVSRRTEVGRGKAVLYVLSTLGLGIAMVWGGLAYQRRTNEAAISDWATSMAAKLRDPLHSLIAGEKFYPSVRVVAAERTWYERSLMEREGTRVNIRRYPALGLPAGGESSLLGTIAQGARIPDVVVSTGWGSFFCRDAEGVIWLGDPPRSDAVCAVDFNYLAASK